MRASKEKLKLFWDFSKSNLEIFLLLLSIIMSILISYGLYFLIWFAFVPLLYLTYTKNYKRIIIYSAIYGIITSIAFFSWVYELKTAFYRLIYVSIILVFTLYFIFFMVAVSSISKKIKGNYAVLLPPVIWILLLLIYSLLPIQIYWMDFAIFQPSLIPLVWYFGSYGITFLIILFNSVIACYFIKKNNKLVFLLLFLASLIIFSILYTNYSDFLYDNKIKVALLQGNFPYSFEWRQNHTFDIVLGTYLNMTLEASKEKPDLVIWPEYSLPQDLRKNENALKTLQKTSVDLNEVLIIGSLKYEGDTNTDTAFVFKPDGTFDTYDSVSPFFLADKIKVIKGNQTNIIQYNNKKFGVVICNEENMQWVVRSHSNQGSQFIVSMSNNQYLGRGMHIIAQFAKLRAAENAKYVVRATNDGLTQIINPFGKVIYSIEPKKQNILIGDIYLNNYKTFYTRYGNFLVYLLIIFSITIMFKKEGK